MSERLIFTLGDVGSYDFQRLPKGLVFQISMNAYNGNVFVEIGNRELAGEFAYKFLKRIVSACDLLETLGHDDPISYLMEMDSKRLQKLMERCEEGDFREKKIFKIVTIEKAC